MQAKDRSHPAALLGMLAIAIAAIGADEPKQTVDAGGMTFEAPGSWKAQRPSSSMRRAQLNVSPAEGDADPAELVVFAFPGGAGTVEANIARWQQQFQGEDGKAPLVSSEKRKGQNTEVTVVEVGGRYVAALTPGSPQRNDKPDYRLLGAIVQTPRVAYFLKMVGPDKTMKAAKSDFDALVASIKVEAP